jgi:hypothetical protein
MQTPQREMYLFVMCDSGLVDSLYNDVEAGRRCGGRQSYILEV